MRNYTARCYHRIQVRFLTFFTTMLLSLPIFASTESLNKKASEIVVDYFNIQSSPYTNETGFFGIHYNINLLPIKNFYTGLGVYSAITGNNGGFFVFGFDNNYYLNLFKNIYFDSGVFIGAGGAHSAKVGGGLMLLPHVGLSYRANKFQLGIDYSYVTFPTGYIKNSQILFHLSLLNDFNFFGPGKGLLTDSNMDLTKNISHLYIGPIVQLATPKKGTKSLRNKLQDNTQGLIGGELGKFITKNSYFGLRATAIAKSKSGNGYMSLMGGLGNLLKLSHSLSIDNDFYIGAGGGGEISTGSGLLLEADTGLSWKITKAIDSKIQVGYLIAPDGNYKAWIGTIGFHYHIFSYSPSSENKLPHINVLSQKIRHWRIQAFHQTLFHPERKDTRKGDIHFLGALLEQQINQNFYLSYGTEFAYSGEHSGGLAAGIVGIGYQINLKNNWHPFVTILSGAIGGGGIDIGGGLFLEPNIGIRYSLSDNFSLNLSGGYIKSIDGKLNAVTATAGLSFDFGELPVISHDTQPIPDTPQSNHTCSQPADCR